MPACAGHTGLILGSGRSPGEGNGNPLLSSCLEIPMERGAWRATAHGVGKSQMRWKRVSMQEELALPPRRGEGAPSREPPPRPRLPPQRTKPSHPRRRARSPGGLARSPGFLFAGVVPLRVMTKKPPSTGSSVFSVVLWRTGSCGPHPIIVLLRQWKKGHNGSHGWCFTASLWAAARPSLWLFTVFQPKRDAHGSVLLWVTKCTLRRTGNHFLSFCAAKMVYTDILLTDGLWVSVVAEHPGSPRWDVCHY